MSVVLAGFDLDGTFVHPSCPLNFTLDKLRLSANGIDYGMLGRDYAGLGGGATTICEDWTDKYELRNLKVREFHVPSITVTSFCLHHYKTPNLTVYPLVVYHHGDVCIVLKSCVSEAFGKKHCEHLCGA